MNGPNNTSCVVWAYFFLWSCYPISYPSSPTVAVRCDHFCHHCCCCHYHGGGGHVALLILEVSKILRKKMAQTMQNASSGPVFFLWSCYPISYPSSPTVTVRCGCCCCRCHYCGGGGGGDVALLVLITREKKYIPKEKPKRQFTIIWAFYPLCCTVLVCSWFGGRKVEMGGTKKRGSSEIIYK